MLCGEGHRTKTSGETLSALDIEDIAASNRAEE